MNPMISCAFNTDTACVELKYVDCSMIAVENEVADHMYQRSKPDWLIYNKPPEYAHLMPEGDPEGHLRGTPEHRLMD